MHDLIQIGSVVIHADENGRFSLNDLHRAAGGEDRHSPNRWTRTDGYQALVAELTPEMAFAPVESTRGGASPGTYAAKELVYAYAMWISASFNLKVIRTFDAVATGNAPPQLGEMREAVDLFQPFFEVAVLIGCDKQAAAISANQAVFAVSGANVLQLMGRTHMKAENQESLFYIPRELGERLGGISAQKVNKMLVASGFQLKVGEQWEVTDSGKRFARIYDTGKKHSSGVPIQQIKWSSEVIPALGRDAA
jgi:hypothetical protein